MGYLRMIKRPYSAVVDMILRKVPGAYIYHQASTSTSVYIKFAGQRMGSLRIGDHKGIEKYRYRWNLHMEHNEPPQLGGNPACERYHYGSNYVKELIADLLEFSSDFSTPMRFIKQEWRDAI